MFQTNPNSNNNNDEDATRPVVARATYLAKLATYPDFTDAAADIDMDIYPLWFSVQQVPELWLLCSMRKTSEIILKW